MVIRQKRKECVSSKKPEPPGPGDTKKHPTISFAALFLLSSLRFGAAA